MFPEVFDLVYASAEPGDVFSGVGAPALITVESSHCTGSRCVVGPAAWQQLHCASVRCGPLCVCLNKCLFTYRRETVWQNYVVRCLRLLNCYYQTQMERHKNNMWKEREVAYTRCWRTHKAVCFRILDGKQIQVFLTLFNLRERHLFFLLREFLLWRLFKKLFFP